MARFWFFGYCLFFSAFAFGGLQPGFSKEEARDMIRLCNSYTFLDLYGTDAEIIPKSYERTYTSGVFGMDNKYQIYVKGDVAVINIRGSTEKPISWMENIFSSMIPATGKMQIEGTSFDYTFSEKPEAAVHAGYALGVAFLSKDVLFHIEHLYLKGIRNIIITGHSQGGALASMLRAFLAHHLSEELSSIRFKVYAFAAPMVGNKVFADDYNQKFSQQGNSFSIVNPADLIPTFPVSYTEKPVADNLMNLLSNDGSFSIKKTMVDMVFHHFEHNIGQYMSKISDKTAGQISRKVGDVVLPPYTQDINYQHLEKRIKLQPFTYPKMLKDSSILQNDSLMSVYQRDENGHFLDQNLYKETPWTFQHKPYNYYVAYLKIYFPKLYANLEKKYLPENL